MKGKNHANYMKQENTHVKKRTLQGIVVSDKMNKTRIVAVTRTKKHEKYHKFYKITRRYKAHDENNAYVVGTNVVIEETRPLSKEKRWTIAREVKIKK